jgi:hypothetical protein
MDRKRKKRTSNEDWKSPSDDEAEIAKLKDGRTALAYKAENAVDMETGAMVAVTTHGGAAADTATVQQTVVDAAIAVAGLIAERHPKASIQCILRESKKWWRTRAITATMSRLVWLSWKCERISRSRIVASATGTARRRSRQRCTAIGDGFTGIVASGYNGNGESGSRGTSRTSLIPADWTGCTYTRH